MEAKQNKAAILKRLARLEGQLRGVTRMVDEGRYCVDVLVQTAAVRSATRLGSAKTTAARGRRP